MPYFYLLSINPALENKMKNSILFFLSIVFLSSCHKSSSASVNSGPTHVDGSVVDITNGNLIANANTELIQIDYSQQSIVGGSPSSGLTVLARKPADANGNFSYDFSANSNYGYEIFSWQNNYVNDPLYATKIDKTPGKSSISVKLQPYAYLKIHLKNSTPSDMHDYISLHIQQIGGTYPTFYGTKVDTTVAYFRLNGNAKNTISWGVGKNGKEYVDDTSVYLKELDTTQININY